ncbi:hypothetical protein ACOMHN_013109 [Nucella lapillus]
MFLQDQDINILATSLLQVPVSFIKPVGSLLLATPSMDPPSVPAAEARDESPDAGVQLCAESAPEGMITSPATPVTTLPSDSYSVLSCQFTPTHVVLHPPTPFSGATEPSSTELKELMLNSSPVRTKCKKLRRRTLCFAQRQNKTPKCQLNLHKLQFKEMKDNIDGLTISQDDMKVTFASLIEDAKTATKNELKTLMKSKINLVSSYVDGLHGEVTQLRASVDILCKENQSLKCQLRNLRSELRDVKARHLVTNAGAQCDPNEHKQTAESSITSVSPASPAVAQFRQTVPAGPVVPTSGKVDLKEPQLRGGDRGDGRGPPPSPAVGDSPPCPDVGGSTSCPAVGDPPSCPPVGDSTSCLAEGGSTACPAVGGPSSCPAVDGPSSCPAVDDSSSCPVVCGSISCPAHKSFFSSQSPDVGPEDGMEMEVTRRSRCLGP